jgi:hypothetical protein
MAVNTIKIKKYSDVIIEKVAHAAIIPGALLELNSDDEVLNHDTVQGSCVPLMFALEDELQGKGINDNYAAGSQVQIWIPGRGDVVYALLKDDQTLAIGDFVESDGYGKVQKTGVPASGAPDVFSQYIIGVVMETITVGAYGSGSESSAAGDYLNPRVKIMIV